MTIRQCYIAITFEKHRTFKLNVPIEVKGAHAFSAIAAISSFLVEKLSKITPSIGNITKEDILMNTSQSYSPLFEFWNVYLGQCILNGGAFRDGENFYIQIPINVPSPQAKQNKDLLAEITAELNEEMNPKQRLSQIFKINTTTQNGISKKMGIYCVHPNNKKLPLLPKTNIAYIWLGLLFNNERWSIYNITDGDIPSVEELETLDSVLVTGSSLSVIYQSPEMKKAMSNLGQAYKLSNKLKLTGICYGHQLIAEYFGAQVAKKQRNGGLHIINLNQDVIGKYKSLARLSNYSQLCLSQHHEDYVETVPEGFELLGASEGCKVQSLISKNERILTAQFHSELPYDYLHLIMRQQTRAGNCNWKYDLNQTPERIERNLKESQLFLHVLREFISS